MLRIVDEDRKPRQCRLYDGQAEPLDKRGRTKRSATAYTMNNTCLEPWRVMTTIATASVPAAPYLHQSRFP